jgi:hypothetical protein
VQRISMAMTGGESGMSAEDVLIASRRYGNHLGVEFGAAHASPAVVADGTAPPPVADSYSDYVQTATPGCRAPHVWLGRPDARPSTLDLFGSAFTLLAAPEGGAWCAAAARLSTALRVRIDAYRIGAPGLNDLGGFAAAYGVQRNGAVLVRPDGHVAWRSPSAPVTGAELETALGQILAHRLALVDLTKGNPNAEAQRRRGRGAETGMTRLSDPHG